MPGLVDNVDGTYAVVSLGGGPGFDYVGIPLASEFCLYHASSKEVGNETPLTQQQRPTENIPICVTIFDYKEGWHDIADDVGNLT